MKKYIRGKAMKDIAARVLDWRLDFIQKEYVINLSWINLCGINGSTKPFYIYHRDALAVEKVIIPVKDFNEYWEEADDLEILKKSAEKHKEKLRIKRLIEGKE